MKRIRCPKCEEAIPFDEKGLAPGRVLVFTCPSCGKQFKIRLKVPASAGEGGEEETIPGRLVVIENAFHLRQEIPLRIGENVVGRYVRGTAANAAFRTVDPSVDTTHCVVTVKMDAAGCPVFLLRDAPSNTGTFLMNHLLGPREQVRIEDGAIVTIGATTMILQTSQTENGQAES